MAATTGVLTVLLVAGASAALGGSQGLRHASLKASANVTIPGQKYLPSGMFPDDSTELEGTDKASDFHWGYNDVKAWGKEFKVCNAGEAQSPIDLPADAKAGKDSLWSKIRYHPVSGRELKNNGHYLKVKGITGAKGEQGFGGLSVPDLGFYKFKQFQLHFPSEHTVGGRQYAGEMQILHRKESLDGTAVDSMSEGDSLLMLSIFFEIQEDGHPSHDDNLFLLQLGFDYEKDLPKAGDSKPIPHQVDLVKAFEPQLKGNFFHYKGSLTAPPCSETVQWYVLRTPAGISQRQVDMFRELRKSAGKAENNRPIQELNGRKVETDHFSAAGARGLHVFALLAGAVALLRA